MVINRLMYSKQEIMVSASKLQDYYSKPLQISFNPLGVNSANTYYTKVLSGLARSKPRSCKDKNLKSCPRWASNGYCTLTRRFMKRNCKKSCNKCPGKITQLANTDRFLGSQHYYELHILNERMMLLTFNRNKIYANFWAKIWAKNGANNQIRVY